MSTTVDEEPAASKRPKETRFTQQKLPAWEPILTAGAVLPVFFAIGIFSIPLGVILLMTANSLSEQAVDYTTAACVPLNAPAAYSTCAQYIANNTGATCLCTVYFQLQQNFSGTVHMYYGLTSYYQNHRLYLKSRDSNQLLGKTETYNQLSSDCAAPYRGVANSSLAGGGIPYAPCGVVANSLFNDSLTISYYGGAVQGWIPVPMINTGIAWNTDKQSMFSNPSNFNNNPRGVFNGTEHPPDWQRPIYDFDTTNPANNGYENEDFIVWMRTAALPSFKKLYRHVNHTSPPFKNGLPAGNYSLNVAYSYPTASFGGSKRMILTTTSWAGGKNPFLGIAYIVIGSICIIVGFIFLFIHFRLGSTDAELSRDVNCHTAYD